MGFLAHFPILEKGRVKNEKAFLLALSHLSPGEVELFQEYQRDVEARPPLHLNGKLFYNLFRSLGAYTGSIESSDHIIYHFGPDHKPKTPFVECIAKDGEWTARAWIPESIESEAFIALDRQILVAAKNTALPRQRTSYNLFEGVEQSALVHLAKASDKRPVTLSHFEFQDLSLYLERSAEVGTQEFYQAIEYTIRKHLKSQDLFFHVLPHSFLVISPGARKEQIVDRFHSIYFQIRSLIFDYEILLVTVEKPTTNLDSIWTELKL